MNKILFDRYNKIYDNIDCNINNKNQLVINIDSIKLATFNKISSYLLKQYDFQTSFKAEGYNKSASFSLKFETSLSNDIILILLDNIVNIINNE